MQRTYREIVGEIVPGHAIAEAERRVYDELYQGCYQCADGMCPLGVMRYAITGNYASSAFPDPSDFRGAHEDASPTVRRRRLALTVIYRANDRGLLATPGSLSRLLDRPFKAEVR